MKRAKDKAVVAAFEKVLVMILGKYFQQPAVYNRYTILISCH